MNKKDQTKAMVVVGLLLIGVAYYISKRNPEGFMNRRMACFDCHEGIEPQDSCPICYPPRRYTPKKPAPGRCVPPTAPGGFHYGSRTSDGRKLLPRTRICTSQTNQAGCEAEEMALLTDSGRVINYRYARRRPCVWTPN